MGSRWTKPPRRHVSDLSADNVAIAARGVAVSFGGTSVLRDIDLDIHTGEIHGLVGENGAGKSTLGKVLGGYYTASAGQLEVFGKSIGKWDAPEALAAGIAIMHQELQLVPALSVAENVFLGIEDQTFGVLHRTEADRLGELMDATGFYLDPDAAADSLSIADRQKIEILRALARDARVIVMDEPTSSLAKDQIAQLHDTMRQLRATGRTVIYVSHFLDDILDVADRVTVLRDGNLVQTMSAENLTKGEIVSAMLGGTKTETPFPPKEIPTSPRPVLVAKDLRNSFGVNGVSLTVGEGEIVGLTGLVGAGRTEIARALVGADPSSGHVEIDGVPFVNRTPIRSTKRGLVMVPEDRRKQGLVMTLPVRSNVSLPHLRRFAPKGLMRQSEERQTTQGIIDNFEVRPASVDGDISSYSGGNQQKVLIGKWLVGDPKIVILDEPSRGVDVGARQLIHEAIAELARGGAGVLVISSEIEEVLGLAHRVCLVDRGQIRATVDAHDTTEAEILQNLFQFQSEPAEAAPA